MRILLVTDSLAPTYGWGRYSIGVIRALRRQGLQFTLLSPKGSCEIPDLLDLDDHKRIYSFVSETRRIPKLVLANAIPIWRALRHCDLVHCITEPYAIPAALVKGKKPLFVTLHGTYAVRPFTRPRERLWYEFAYRRAERLLPVSRFTESLLPQRFRGPRTHVVPEGVDTERFRLSAQPNAPDRPFILSVGPIKRRKGYHATIEAFARVHQSRPDVQYRIVGGTDDRVFMAQLQARIGELGLENAVVFMGRLPDDELVRLYHQCTLFWLLPVDDDLQFEGFGLVYWEANASGRPIIGARRTGAEDAIEDGVNGFLVEAHDADAASRAALRLLQEPQLASQMGAAGRQRVRPWDEAAALLMQEYRDVLAGTSPAAQPAMATR
ncbi:MAG TPA: glycosyltransferase family 4 protein [Chloroflexota bacterium]|nr:glycosyltransferase family 4 protein [Chloroflexota bacterium]